MWVFPLAAAVVSGIFGWILLRQWWTRRRPHQIAWAVALAMFGTASLAAAAGLLVGWNSGWFRTYYLFGAVINVPVLGLGTSYLLAPRRWANITAVVVVGFSALAIVVVFSTSLLPRAGAELAGHDIPHGSAVMPDSVRMMARYYSFVGFVVVVGGALWSSLRLRRQGAEHLRGIAKANLLIAAGTFVVALGSGFAFYGEGWPFSIGLLAGVSLMFWGFLKSRVDGSPKRTPVPGSLLNEGWYLMSTTDLERELARFRRPQSDHRSSGVVPLGIEEALAFKHAGNMPDGDGRWLRLVLHVGDVTPLEDLNERRLLFEPDLHEAPDWRRQGSKPVNVVPLRSSPVEFPAAPKPWWEESVIRELEEEWREKGTVAGLPVPEEYRGFVFKTVLALQAAGDPVTAEGVADSIQRWLSPADAARIRAALLDPS
ncbi:MAG: hypothetical protein ACR2LG_14355 [Actinomycetota bacterium]